MLWLDEAYGFAPQMEKVMGCALFLSATVYRAVELVVQLPVCSG